MHLSIYKAKPSSHLQKKFLQITDDCIFYILFNNLVS